MTGLKLEVGKSYRAKNGKRVDIYDMDPRTGGYLDIYEYFGREHGSSAGPKMLFTVAGDRMRENSEWGLVAEWVEPVASPTPIEAATAIPGGGTKHDANKPDLSLLPSVFLVAVARAMMWGEKKYGRYNYARGFEVTRLIAAMERHVVAYNDGENLDPESGVSHLGHAAACALMILRCAELGTLKDNRYLAGVPAKMEKSA